MHTVDFYSHRKIYSQRQTQTQAYRHRKRCKHTFCSRKYNVWYKKKQGTHISNFISPNFLLDWLEYNAYNLFGEHDRQKLRFVLRKIKWIR